MEFPSGGEIPYNPKLMRKKCEIQCYSQHYQQKVREVMRFSGPYLIKGGDWPFSAIIWHRGDITRTENAMYGRVNSSPGISS